MYALPLFFRVEHDASDPPLQQPLWLMLSRHSFPFPVLVFFFSVLICSTYDLNLSLSHKRRLYGFIRNHISSWTGKRYSKFVSVSSTTAVVLVVDTWLVKYKQNMSFRLFLPHVILFLALLSSGGVISYFLSFMDYFTAKQN